MTQTPQQANEQMQKLRDIAYRNCYVAQPIAKSLASVRRSGVTLDAWEKKKVREYLVRFGAIDAK